MTKLCRFGLQSGDWKRVSDFWANIQINPFGLYLGNPHRILDDPTPAFRTGIDCNQTRQYGLKSSIDDTSEVGNVSDCGFSSSRGDTAFARYRCVYRDPMAIIRHYMRRARCISALATVWIELTSPHLRYALIYSLQPETGEVSRSVGKFFHWQQFVWGPMVGQERSDRLRNTLDEYSF